jgi:Tfp pilus assembly protein PilF
LYLLSEKVSMTRSAPQRKKRIKEREQVGSKFGLQFLFEEAASAPIPPGSLSEFANKIRSEHASQTEVCYLYHSDPATRDNHRLVRYVAAGSGEMREMIREGYVVLLAPGALEAQVNPNDLFRLPLPGNPSQKVYFEILFKGKKEESPGGLILPSDLMRYLLALSSDGSRVNHGVARMILNRLGFKKEVLVVHQEASGISPRMKPIPMARRLWLNLAWNTSLPLKEARDPSLKKLFFRTESPLFRLAFFATALALFLAIPILSLDAGLSGDDEKHYAHAAKVYRYFTEDDPSALNDPVNKLNYYGQSFDFFTYLLIRLFNLEESAYEARHVMVAISGAAAILFTALLVRLFAGYAGGWLAMVVMFFSPPFLGHAFNNPMDVPFALGNIFTLYHLILFLRKLPAISLRSALWIALGIGWTIGIRIGGLLLVPYLFFFSGLYLLVHKWPWNLFSFRWWGFALKGLGILVGISLSGYLLSLLTWPYALQDVINNPIQAFKIMTNIQVSIRVLYDGLVQWSDNLPWHYIPKNVLLTVPVIVLAGWVASLSTWIIDRKEANGFWYFMLWFTVLFPVIFIIYRKSNVYGGWRHMLFIYPSMVALSAVALNSLARRMRNTRLRYGALLVLAAGLFHPFRHVIVNHPNTYIYFNELSGGINRTYGKYETDYYASSLRPATDYFIKTILPQLENAPGKPVRVVSNSTIGYYFRNHIDRVQSFYSRYYDRGNHDWDYAILYCNYIHPYQLTHGLWPPKNTVHEIKVDDVVVAAIVERKNRDDYLGASLMAEGMREQDREKLDRARIYLENAVAYDPNNEAACLELGNIYSAFLRFDDARSTMDHLLEIYPEYDKALNIKGYTYLIESEAYGDPALIDEAIRIISQAVQSNYKFYSGYYNLGLCYGMKDDRDNAEYNLRQAIRYNGKFKAAYEKLAELYDYYGETELAERAKEQARRLP